MNELKSRLSTILDSPSMGSNEKLQKICTLLDQEISYYNWTGFYFRDGDKEQLVLGPYTGDATDHTVIPFGRGICGQVAVSGETFVVPDVAAEDNYLSCSSATKAEIVVPIFKDGQNVGQIDIDSHTANPFTAEDRELLEWLAKRVAGIL